VHEAGDHFFVLGQVHSLAVEHPHSPLLFLQGRYADSRSPSLRTAIG